MESIIIVSFLIVSVLGVLTHYIHPWIKRGILAHIIGAVNESVWEHLKLSFYPMVIVMIVHSFIPSLYYDGFWGTAFIVIFSSVVLIPILYYPIRKILKKEVPVVSIILYFICILLSFVIEYYLIKNKVNLFNTYLSILLIVLMFVGFAYLTFFPPKINMFKDPIHEKYGEFKQRFDKSKKL